MTLTPVTARTLRPSPRLVLSVVCLATFFVSLSSSTLSVAVPVVVRHFGAGALTASFIILTPSATSTALMLSMGRAGDIAGRRNAYLAGIGVFTIASLAAGFALASWMLIALEAAEAIGTATIWANSAAILLELLPEERINAGLGVYIASISVADLIGPSVGGAIVSAAGWQWIFLLNVPVGVACLLVGRYALRSAHLIRPSARDAATPARRPRLDLPGNVLVLAGLGGLIASISLGQTSGFLSPPVLGGVLGALGILAVFSVSELRAQEPLLDLRMFADRSLALAMASAFANAMAQWSPVLLMVLYYQAVSGDSPLLAGLKVTALPIVSGAAAVATGRLSARIRPDTLALVGAVTAFAGLVLLVATLGSGYGANLLALVLIGLGGGLFGPTNANVVMSRAPRVNTGVINGTRLMLQNVGWVTSTAVVLTIVTAPLAVGLRGEFFAGTASRVSRAVAAELVTGYGHALALLAAFGLIGSIASLFSRTYASRDPAAAPDSAGAALRRVPAQERCE